MEQHKINYRKYFAFYLSGDGSRMRVDDFNRDDGTRVRAELTPEVIENSTIYFR